MDESEAELASTLWIQLLIMVGLTVITYVLMEVWRRYLFFGCWMVLIFDICLFPFIFGSHSLFFTAKWLMLPPVLLICSIWRISCVELTENEKNGMFFRKILIKISEILCQTKGKDKKLFGARKFMEWFCTFFLFLNILTAVVQGILVGSIMNAVCGILVMFSIPIPAKLLYNKHSHFIDTENSNNYYDWNAITPPLWIIAYSSWNFCFVWQYAPFAVFWCALHLGPCFISSFIQRDYNIYLELRLFCLSFLVMIHSPSAEYEGILPWVLEGQYFKNIMHVGDNYIIFEIWGTINTFIAICHIITYIQWIRKQRQIDQIKEDSDERTELVSV